MISDLKEIKCKHCGEFALDRIESVESLFTDESECLILVCKCRHCEKQDNYLISSDKDIA